MDFNSSLNKLTYQFLKKRSIKKWKQFSIYEVENYYLSKIWFQNCIDTKVIYLISYEKYFSWPFIINVKWNLQDFDFFSILFSCYLFTVSSCPQPRLLHYKLCHICSFLYCSLQPWIHLWQDRGSYFSRGF